MGFFFFLNLVPDLKMKALSFSPFSMELAVDLLYMSLIILRCIFSVPNLLSIFNPKGMLDFFNSFPASIAMITSIFHSLGVF